MDLEANLIESKKRKQKGGYKPYLFSITAHGLLIASLIFVGANATHR